MTASLTIVLPVLPPAEYSANNSRGRSFWHKKEARADAMNAIGVALNEAGWHPGAPPLPRAKVSVRFYLPTRVKRDPGGLVERMKVYFDALTVPTYAKDGLTVLKPGYGVLEDDDLDCIGWPEYSHEYRPRQPGTVITIEKGRRKR